MWSSCACTVPLLQKCCGPEAGRNVRVVALFSNSEKVDGRVMPMMEQNSVPVTADSMGKILILIPVDNSHALDSKQDGFGILHVVVDKDPCELQGKTN